MGRHVCVIDNDSEFVAMLSDVLAADANCIVQAYTRAPDPDELVAARPDLLLLDLRLGSVDAATGWTLLQAVRARDELRDLPVIVCSGDVLALQEYAGSLADDPRVTVLEKPFGVDELLRALAWGCGDGRGEPLGAVLGGSLPASRWTFPPGSALPGS